MIQVSPSVLICDAKTWSTKKKHEKSVKTISETGLYLCWIGIELCTRDGTLIADPNLVHQIAKRESFFQKLGCPAVVNGS